MTIYNKINGVINLVGFNGSIMMVWINAHMDYNVL